MGDPEAVLADFVADDEQYEHRHLKKRVSLLSWLPGIQRTRTLMYDAMKRRTSKGRSRNGPMPLKSTNKMHDTMP